MIKLNFRTLGLLLLVSVTANAQSSNELYGIVRKNYFTTIYNPIDSSIISQQFDSATVRLGMANTTTGVVYNAGNYTYNDAVNMTGAALNPYNDSYIFMGASEMITVDLNNGQFTNQVPLTNPIASSFFDNFRFNNSDSTLYGLARRNVLDPITGNYVGEVYLAKADNITGVITQISPNSVAQGFALSGSAIDPYQMVFYFIAPNGVFMGLDLYNGAIFSNPLVVTPANSNFGDFAYSCADTSLYGLVSQNYFYYTPDPFSPGDSIAHLDSTALKLGKINPVTGVVTVISPYGVSQGGYVVNSGAAIDPNTMTFYYSSGDNLIGVSLQTGLMVSNTTLNFIDGDHFNLMRDFDNCISAHAVRSDPGLTSVSVNDDQHGIKVYPNPVNTTLHIICGENIRMIEISTVDGKIVSSFENTPDQSVVDISKLVPGMYFIRFVNDEESLVVQKFFKY